MVSYSSVWFFFLLRYKVDKDWEHPETDGHGFWLPDSLPGTLCAYFVSNWPHYTGTTYDGRVCLISKKLSQHWIDKIPFHRDQQGKWTKQYILWFHTIAIVPWTIERTHSWQNSVADICKLPITKTKAIPKTLFWHNHRKCEDNKKKEMHEIFKK